jgi:alkyldihydroxyacetonephosphate synthase
VTYARAVDFDTNRKIWGWGLASVTPPEEMLALARGYLGARFGLELGAPRPAPTLDTIRMGPSRVAPAATLAAFVTDARFDRAAHTFGKAFRDVVRALEGDYDNAPDLVAYPRDEAEVASILAWASEARVAVVPFGGGSSVVGGIEIGRGERARFAGVLSLDLCRMDRVLEIDRTSRAARIQAGAYGPALEAQLAPHGLTLRHFPQSFEFSTLGGWIATRAGGHYATNHTHIDDFVEAVRAVTPEGVLSTRRLPGNGAGPQEERLWLGSEGVLGVITEAWVRLQDAPRRRARATVRFDSFSAGADAARALAQSGLHPSNARLVERDEALFMGAGDGQSDVLLLGFESSAISQAEPLRAAIAICEAHGGKAGKPSIQEEGDARASDGQADRWKDAFIRAPYLRDELVRMGLVSETFETCTTWSSFPALDRAVREAARSVLDAHLGGLVTCRFTHLYPDGPAPYYTVIAPARAGEQLALWDAVKHAVSTALVAHGGTITHHHAVGRDHRPYYVAQSAPLSLAMLRAAKAALDPAGILNPGALLP